MHRNSLIIYETITINMIALFPVSARSPVHVILLTGYLSKSKNDIVNSNRRYVFENNP